MKVPLIASDPSIHEGQPTIAGSSVRVTDLLRWLAEGNTIKQIIKDRPELSRDGVTAAIKYAILALEAQADEPIRGPLLDKLLDMGFGWDTEDRPPGPPGPPDMRTAIGYEGRAQTNK